MKTETPWAAMKFYVGFLLDGGQQARIPCVMPSGDWLPRAPSFRIFTADEAIGEPAALVKRIDLSIVEAVDKQTLTVAQVRALVYGASLQVRHNRRAEHAETIRKATGRVVPVMATRTFQERTRKASGLAKRLEPYFKERKVI